MMQNTGVRVMFLHQKPTDGTKRGPKNGTVAMQVDGTTVRYQVVTLNPVDEFDRYEGAYLAKEALQKNPLMFELDDLPTSMHDVHIAVMQAIVEGKHPTRAKNAAKHWLRSLEPRGSTCCGGCR